MGAVILAKVRGTVRTKSVCAIANTAGMKNGILNCNAPFFAEQCQRAVHHGLMAIAGEDHRMRES
jgi:hypothetical protein